MQAEFAPAAGGSNDAPHWVEVIDAQGGFPTRWLGPYGSAQQAARAGRAVLRLLNPARYRAVVQAQPPGPSGAEGGLGVSSHLTLCRATAPSVVPSD